MLVRPKGIDGIHNKRGLYADEAAYTGIATLKFLHQQPIFDVVHTGATVALKRSPVEAKFFYGTHKISREMAVAVALLNDGDKVVFHKGACVGADDKFVIGKKGVKLDEINALKLECHRCTF
jgi:hypothetical protein